MRVRFGLLVTLATILISLSSAASAQDAPANFTPPAGFTFVQGGEPGIHVLLEGRDIADAGAPHTAFKIDPSQAVNVTFSFHPPENVTWELREIRLGLLVNGPSSEAPDRLTQKQSFNATLPPTGSTVFVNRTVDLAQLKSLGTGLFMMKVDIIDANGGALYAGTFFVHVTGNVFFTVAGATVTVASVGTGYGLWRIAQDVREMIEARDRHKKHEAAATRGAAKAKTLGVQALNIAGGLTGILNAAGNADAEANRLQRRGAVRWTATGLGLGGVAISWLQFLGYVPLDLGATLVTAATVGAAFLTAVLLVIALRNRLIARRTKQRRESKVTKSTKALLPSLPSIPVEKQGEEEATRTLIPEEGPAPASEPTSDITRTGPRR